MERKGPGAKVPGSERAREREFQGANWPGSEKVVNRVRIRVKVRVSVMVRVNIRTSWVVNFAIFRYHSSRNFNNLIMHNLPTAITYLM